MTHKTGPRRKLLDRGFQKVSAALDSLKPNPTASERLHILHDAAWCLINAVQPWDRERDREFKLAERTFVALSREQMRILKYILKPDEDECPTCPK